MKSFDIICIGESLRDIFYLINEATISCSIHKDQCLLCLEYAEKIPVKDVIKIPAAGNAANASVTAVRLGLKSALVSWIGDDPAGDDLKKHLKNETIDVSLVCNCTKQQTSEATILSFQGERTQLLFFKPRQYKLSKLPQTKCIYYFAMGEKFQGFDKQLASYLQKNKKIIFCFQPGTTHIRAGLNNLKRLVGLSHIFILNKDEAMQLLGGENRTIKNMLESFHNIGARISVITDGRNGAYSFDGKNHLFMPIFDGEAKERTGAGDAFASAFACAVLKNLTIAEALRWGTANAWSAVKYIGPQAGLLRKTEMDKTLKVYPAKPKNI